MTSDQNLNNNPIPRTLETPPRTTGNAQQDLPILIDWFYRAYQVIQQAVNYINNEVSPSVIAVANLPDPNGTTLAQAQQTANDAFALATTNDNRWDGLISGEFTISDTDIGSELTFADEQPDTNYRVFVQAKSITGTPSNNAYTVKTKTYLIDKFTVIMLSSPGSGNSITYEWQLIRND